MSTVFNPRFDPILLPGETATLITPSEHIDVQCIAVGALPEYLHDFGALTAATWDVDQEDANLEMTQNEFAQLRIRIVDDMKMELNNLGTTKQWRTAKTNFYLRQFPTSDDEGFLKEFLFKSSEFFIWQKDTPRFDFYSDVALTKSRVKFSGWRFRIRKIAAKGRINIIISGWPSQLP